MATMENIFEVSTWAEAKAALRGLDGYTHSLWYSTSLGGYVVEEAYDSQGRDVYVVAITPEATAALREDFAQSTIEYNSRLGMQWFSLALEGAAGTRRGRRIARRDGGPDLLMFAALYQCGVPDPTQPSFAFDRVSIDTA